MRSIPCLNMQVLSFWRFELLFPHNKKKIIPSWWTQPQGPEHRPRFQSQQERRSPPSEVGRPGGDDEGDDDDGQPSGGDDGDDDGDDYLETITALIRYSWLWSSWSVDINHFYWQIKWRPLFSCNQSKWWWQFIIMKSAYHVWPWALPKNARSLDWKQCKTLKVFICKIPITKTKTKTKIMKGFMFWIPVS